MLEMKDKITKILLDGLGYVYCHNCSAEHCEDCNRKEIGWSISKEHVESLTSDILKVLN